MEIWKWEYSGKSTQAITQSQGNQGCLFICPHLPHHSKPGQTKQVHNLTNSEEEKSFFEIQTNLFCDVYISNISTPPPI